MHPLNEQQKSHFSDAADLYVPVFVIFGATVGAAVGVAVTVDPLQTAGVNKCLVLAVKRRARVRALATPVGHLFQTI